MIKKKGTCGCGRSPTGNCIGWHKLTEEEYKKSFEHYKTSKIFENGPIKYLHFFAKTL